LRKNNKNPPLDEKEGSRKINGFKEIRKYSKKKYN